MYLRCAYQIHEIKNGCTLAQYVPRRLLKIKTFLAISILVLYILYLTLLEVTASLTGLDSETQCCPYRGSNLQPLET